MKEAEINAERLRDQKKMQELAAQKAKIEKEKRDQLAASKEAEKNEALARQKAEEEKVKQQMEEMQ